MAGINFRNTAGYVADGAGETYSLGEAYPTTRGGLTFGFSASLAANSRNRDSGVDRRLAGCVFAVNTAGTTDFVLDLPSGPGAYAVRIALGDAGNAQNHKCVIKDGASVLGSIEADTTVGQFLDATGAVLFSGTWPGGNTAVPLTFASGQIVLTIGGDPSGTLSTALAHLSVVSLATPSDLSGNVDLDATVAAGTMGSSASDLSGGVTLDAVAVGGAMGLQPGTCIVQGLRNWNGSLALAEVVPWVTFCRLTDAQQVLILANQVTHGTTADLSVTNAALVIGTWYMAMGWNADGSKRFAVPVQAA
jgi:hypothetical protein